MLERTYLVMIVRWVESVEVEEVKVEAENRATADGKK